MMKKIFYTIGFYLLFVTQSFSQDSTLNNYFIEKGYAKDTPVFIVVLNSNDCFKCKLPLSQSVELLKNSRFKNEFKKYIITNNFTYGKLFNSESNLDANVIYDKAVFNLINSATKSGVFLMSKNFFYSAPIQNFNDSIFNATLKQSAEIAHNINFLDSTVDINFSRCVTPFGYLIFDALIQQGIYISLDKRISYKNIILTDTNFINRLPDRANSVKYEKLSYKKNNELLSSNHFKQLHVNSITTHDSMLYCIYSLLRFFKDRESENGYSVFTMYYLATKKINSQLDLNEVFDLKKYDKTYYIDTFSFQNQTYPIGNHINFRPLFLNDSTFSFNVNHVNEKEKKYGFGGLAKIVLRNNGCTKMIEIDTAAKNIETISKYISYQNSKFIIEKKMTDESQNIGWITIQRIN